MITIYDPTTRTAAQWREMSQQARRTSQESYERCDTDGFLSQWANDRLAHLYSQIAGVAEDGGMFDFYMLTDLEGNRLDATQVKNQYGKWSWRIWDPETRRVSWFAESYARKGATRRANNRKKGYTFHTFRGAAVYKTGTGWIPAQGAELIDLGEVEYNDDTY